MNSQFTENALSWGEEGKLWLESIPSLIKEYEAKWSIQVLPPFNLSYNYVAPVKRNDGTDAVLKIGFPKDKEFQTEIKALQIFKGEGCVRLLESVPINFVILIEYVKPGIPLSTLENDDEATRVIARIIKKLHKPLPKDHNFTTITEWSSALSNYLKRHGSNGPLSYELVELANRLFLELIHTSAPAVLVHGDLHHDNIISSEREEWLAIDPKGIAAEYMYEVAAMIRNPYEKLKDIKDLEPFLRRRILILSQELRADPTRLHKWCIAQTVLSAVWNVESSKGPEHAVRVAEVLAKMKL